MGKLILYKLIYNIKSIEIGIFKIYIKINLVNSFIQSFKSLIKALILFFKK